jgi:hypothetical protein
MDKIGGVMNYLKLKAFLPVSLALVLLYLDSFSYPPAVGIIGKSRNCVSCHKSNGPWKDEAKTVIDIIDKETGKSLGQPDGSFLITAKRWQAKKVLTVIGRTKDDKEPVPVRNGWLYVDPNRITQGNVLSKFPPGWAVNLPMACRLVGDVSERYPGAKITVLPMTIRPTEDAKEATIELQIMLTKGESVKDKPAEGLLANYYDRKVILKVED